MLPPIAEAAALQPRIESISTELEVLMGRRDKLLAELGEFVRQGRDVLTGVYRDGMRRLAEFGFAVDDTPRPKKSTTAPVKA